METEIKFEPSGRAGLVPVETYLFDAAKRLGVEIEDECGRHGECDSCAVEIRTGGEFLSGVTKAETRQLGEARLKKGERLACQTKIEKLGEIVVMTKEKKREEKPQEEQKMDEFRKEFKELPLEKKVASLVELEMVTLGETFNFVLNTPYKIVEKVMDVMAEFGLRQETEAKKAQRPAEHVEAEGEADGKAAGGETKSKPRATKKTAPKKSAASKAPDTTQASEG